MRCRTGGGRDTQVGNVRAERRSRLCLRCAPATCRRTRGCRLRTRGGDSAAFDVDPFRIVELRRVAILGADDNVIWVPGSTTPPICSLRHFPIAQLIGLAKCTLFDRAFDLRGPACSCARAPGSLDRQYTPLPIRLVVVSCPAFRRKMQLCSNSASRSSPRSCRAVSVDSTSFGVPRVRTTVCDERAQIIQTWLPRGYRVRAAAPSTRVPARQDREPPAPQVVAIFLRNRHRLEMYDRHARGEVFDQIILAAAGEPLPSSSSRSRRRVQRRDGRFDGFRLQRFASVARTRVW